jgi:hypothetical protein
MFAITGNYILVCDDPPAEVFRDAVFAPVVLD